MSRRHKNRHKKDSNSRGMVHRNNQPSDNKLHIELHMKDGKKHDISVSKSLIALGTLAITSAAVICACCSGKK